MDSTVKSKPVVVDAGAAGPGVMDALRERTTEHHERAERHAFQKALASGRLARPAYAENIGQLMLVHAELERAIGALRAFDARAGAIVEGRLHAGVFADELRYLSVDAGKVRPLAEVAAVIGELRAMAAGEPLSVLGMLYVLEGSTNGGVFIAKAVTRAYGLTGPEGTRWLNPYGERQRAAWIGFKQSMEAAGFSAAEVESMVRAARWMFDAVSRVGSAVLARHVGASAS